MFAGNTSYSLLGNWCGMQVGCLFPSFHGDPVRVSSDVTLRNSFLSHPPYSVLLNYVIIMFIGTLDLLTSVLEFVNRPSIVC